MLNSDRGGILDARLLRAIEVWCARNGMSAGAFGAAVYRDRGFVASLRDGRRPCRRRPPASCRPAALRWPEGQHSRAAAQSRTAGAGTPLSGAWCSTTPALRRPPTSSTCSGSVQSGTAEEAEAYAEVLDDLPASLEGAVEQADSIADRRFDKAQAAGELELLAHNIAGHETRTGGHPLAVPGVGGTADPYRRSAQPAH